MRYFLSGTYCQKRFFYLFGGRNPLLQGIRISYYEKSLGIIAVRYKLAYSGSSLDTDGRLEIALLHHLTTVRQIKNYISFNQVIKVGGAILSAFLIRKYNHMST